MKTISPFYITEMRHIRRYSKPEILEKKQKEWTEKFIESGKSRPSSKQYGHHDILEALKNMSGTKCFYCESLLKGKSKEIDHLIEVTQDKTLAFEWSNLYLACNNCNNGRPKESEISKEDVLDPCRDSDEEIKANLSFVTEQIIGLHEKGWDTIKKFKLDSEKLDHLRMKHLHNLRDKILEILKSEDLSPAHIENISEDGKKEIMLFTSPRRKFSLMCECFLRKNYPQLFSE